jgi:hypothetical protein
MKKLFLTLSLFGIFFLIQPVVLASAQELSLAYNQIADLAVAEINHHKILSQQQKSLTPHDKRLVKDSLRALSKQKKLFVAFINNKPETRNWLLAKALSLGCSTAVSALVKSGLPLNFTINDDTVLQKALAVSPEPGQEDRWVNQIEELLFYKARVLAANQLGENALTRVQDRLLCFDLGTRVHSAYREAQTLLKRAAGFEIFMNKQTKQARLWQARMYALSDWVQQTGFY